MKKSLAAVGLLGLVACSSGGANAAAPQSYGGPQTQQQQGIPGANGLLAAIDGHTLQVQSSSEQTAVTWSATTTISDTVTTNAAAVTVGSCVMVRDSTTPTASNSLTAGSVSVSAPVNGACAGRQDRRQFGPVGTPPPGAPSGQPPGVVGGGAVGKVVSKTATGFLVQGTVPGQTTARTTKVTTTSATTYTTERRVTAAALTVGQCISARGQSDSAGTVAARSITIRPKVNGSCDSVIVGFGGSRG